MIHGALEESWDFSLTKSMIRIFFVFGSLHLEIYSGTESSENKNTSIASFDLDNTQEAWCLI